MTHNRHGEFVHLPPNNRFADSEALGGEVEGDHDFGVSLDLDGGKAEFTRRPEAYCAAPWL